MASRRTLVVILLLAVTLRIGVAVALWERPPRDDELAYHMVALSLLQGRGFQTERQMGLVNPGGAPTSAWGCARNRSAS